MHNHFAPNYFAREALKPSAFEIGRKPKLTVLTNMRRQQLPTIVTSGGFSCLFRPPHEIPTRYYYNRIQVLICVSTRYLRCVKYLAPMLLYIGCCRSLLMMTQ